MTNGEKFKTAEERNRAYVAYCESMRKENLPIMYGRFEWLDLEYKEEVKKCPFCGGTPVMANNIDSMRSLSYYVKCACGVRTASALSTRAAAAIWNRRVK